MSQYSRPLVVLMGVPVTLVGALVAGLGAGFFAGVVWAMARAARASRVIARIPMTVFIIPPFLHSMLVSTANSTCFGAGGCCRASLGWKADPQIGRVHV